MREELSRSQTGRWDGQSLDTFEITEQGRFRIPRFVVPSELHNTFFARAWGITLSSTGPSLIASIDVESGEGEVIVDEDERMGPHGFHDGKLIYGLEEDEIVRAVDSETGDEQWVFDPNEISSNSGGDFGAPPTIVDDEVFITSRRSGYAYSLDPEDGSMNWRYDANSLSQDANIVVRGNEVYFHGRSDGVIGLNRDDGSAQTEISNTEIFGEEADGEFITSYPISRRGEILYLPTFDWGISAVNLDTEDTEWSLSLGDLVYRPTIYDGVLYIVARSDSGGNLYAIDPETGDEIWNDPLDGTPFSGADIFHDKIFVYDLDNNIYRYDLDGNREEKTELPSRISHLVQKEDGIYGGLRTDGIVELNTETLEVEEFIFNEDRDDTPDFFRAEGIGFSEANLISNRPGRANNDDLITEF